MSQIMAEAFARGLIDKIMVQVLDVIDHDTQDGKSWEQRVDEETGDAQSDLIRGRSQEHTHVNYSKAEEMELIAKIVRDLRDIQIGDSRYVLPPSLLALEKQVQVKCAACNVDSPPGLANPADIAETRITQGQGDTHQIVHTAILESPTEQATDQAKTARKEKEGESANEAARVSVGLLHQLIGELTSKTATAVCPEEDTCAGSSSSKQCIVANWEENEEQLIRTIEDTGNALEILRETESSGCFRDVDLKRPDVDELRSRSSQNVATTSKEINLEKIQVEKCKSNTLSSSSKPSCNDHTEEILPVDNVDKRRASGEATKKKSGLGSRLRKLFRAAFGRRKN